jgi:hypothetical protein
LGTETTLIDVDRLAEGVSGLMKVYELADKWAAYRLTDELGKTLSCYNGAVRIYWPRFGLTLTSVRHFAWMPVHLRTLHSTDDFVAQVSKLGAEASSYRLFEPELISRLRDQIETDARAERRSQASDDAVALLEELIQAEDGLKTQQAKTRALEAENITLRQNLEALLRPRSHAPEQILNAQLVQAEENTEPVDVLDAVNAAREECTNLVILPSAVESAKDSPYKNPVRVLQALQAVDEVACIWGKSISACKPAGSFKQLFRDRGFEYKDDISQTSKGKWGDEYVAAYNGQKVDIAPHITIGAKQADTCISIHMYWDKVSCKAVIAHVGRHKTNTKT